MPVLSLGIFAFSFLCLFGVGEILKEKLKIESEYTRKLIHLITGLIVLLFPFYFSNPISVFLLCSSFLILLSMSKKHKMLNSINGIKRKSYGSEYYPISVFICFLVYYFQQNIVYYYLPILILAIADPLAAIVGMKTQFIKFKLGGEYKTIGGSIAFIFVALIITTLTFYSLDLKVTIGSVLIISIITTMVEAISKKGSDNLWIPISTIISIYLLNL